MAAIHTCAAWAALAPALALAAGAPAAGRAAAPLAGTQWQLAAIESMADEQPTLRPADPSRLTLAFGADGRARLTLDCNRGSAGWQAEPAMAAAVASTGSSAVPGDALPRQSGRLRFGPLAASRAACGPGSLAPRLAAALPHVRSYVVEGGQLHLALWADGGLLHWRPAPALTAVQRFQGTLTGRGDAHHAVQGLAGQTLRVRLTTSNPSQAFNVLPPGSAEAMYLGAISGEQAVLRLPADGRYTLDTFLMRNAARRGERARYTLTATVSGTALLPLPPAQDALVSGTAFHATARLSCQPAGTAPGGDCEAGVRRYGHDGTATVEVRGANGLLRRLLFEQGRLSATDSAQTATSQRTGDTTTVTIGRDERYAVPDALLNGG